MSGGGTRLTTLGLSRGESARFVIRGDCMAPLIDGARVLVRRQRVYWPGDVVLIRRRNHWSAHRFLGYAPSRHGWVAVSQADDARDADPLAPVSRIVGRVDCGVALPDRARASWRYLRAALRRSGRGLA